MFRIFRRFIVVIGLVSLIGSPLLAQDQPAKFFAAGVGIDSQSAPQAMGWGAMALPLTGNLLSYTDYDVSVIPGSTLQDILQTKGLQFSIRTGLAQKVLVYNRLSLWGLLNAGIGAGGAPETVTKASFAMGGFIDISFGRFGVLGILQEEKNASPQGFRFIPRFGIRYRFE